MRFYTIKLPKFLGGIVRAMLLNTFKRLTITGCFFHVIVKKPIGSFYYATRSILPDFNALAET